MGSLQPRCGYVRLSSYWAPCSCSCSCSAAACRDESMKAWMNVFPIRQSVGEPNGALQKRVGPHTANLVCSATISESREPIVDVGNSRPGDPRMPCRGLSRGKHDDGCWNVQCNEAICRNIAPVTANGIWNSRIPGFEGENGQAVDVEWAFHPMQVSISQISWK